MNVNVYIAGPVTGLPNYNKEAFAIAEQQLSKPGINVINPHKLVTGVNPDDWKACMKLCIASLTTATHVLMLDGWKNSRGATFERLTAHTLGIPVFYNVHDVLEELDYLLTNYDIHAAIRAY